MTLLLIDAGNTRIKWAMVDAQDCRREALGNFTYSGMVSHADFQQLGAQWSHLTIDRVIISNVAGQRVHEALQQALLDKFGSRRVPIEWFGSAALLAGIHNHYREPTQLGCDRFASVIGAHTLFPNKALIVATCGTATTIDAISVDGIFFGGMILPGLGLMATSLARNTAQLPQIGECVVVKNTFADNTDDAIISGCIAAQAGAIERAVAAHHLHDGSVQCILSGGAASMISPALSIPYLRIDNLVLLGLHAVAIHNVLIEGQSPC
jgi:type III pantothenate kinase